MKVPEMRLDGNTALVTGGGSGIGEAVAFALAHYGADVAITELPAKMEQAEKVAATIAEATGRKIIAVPLQLPDLKSIDAAVSETAQRLGKIDILINNAGIQIAKPALEVTEADWDAVLDINLKGAFFASQRVAHEMIAQKYGRIINMASQNGLIGYYKRAAYCSAKAGLVNLTRVLAIEWAEYGINVNAVGPTFIRTPLAEQTFKDEKLYNDIISRIPLGRVGEPEEVVGAVVFLASPLATLVTGHTLMVDGGWTAM